MKALNLYEKQDVRYEDVAMPEITDEQDVIIKVITAGICGSDISRFGKIGSYHPGLTWGHEFAGRVVKTGNGVQGIKVGDRVVACPCFPCYACDYCLQGRFARCLHLEVLGGHRNGAFADYISVPAANVVAIPPALDYAAATFVEPSCVVVHGLNQITVRPGASVAVVGCGTIGLLAVQWAKVFGASRVYAFDTDMSKLETAEKTGADAVFNVTEKACFQHFAAVTGNKGCDVVIESSGNAAGIASSLTLAAKGGCVLMLGIPYGDVPLPRDSFEKIIRNELTVKGSWNSISAPFPGREWGVSVDYLSKGIIDVQPLITHRITLAQAPTIFPQLYARELPFIKVLIDMEAAG